MTDADPRLAGVAPRREWPNCRPRDAATMIIVDTSGPAPRVLMGRRHQGHTFMPGMFVFPGGRIHAADHRTGALDDLHPAVQAKLLVDLKGRASPARARALALAAIRETFEETGLLLGRRVERPAASRSPAWRDFLAHGVVPALGDLRLIARAITPPRRSRRFDARFFCIGAETIALAGKPVDGELLEIEWLTFARALDLDLPIITRVVLDDLAGKLTAGHLPKPESPVPYYAMRYGRMRRTLL